MPTYCMPNRALSVKTRIWLRERTAPTSSLPSVNRCEPALLVAVIVQSVRDSVSDHRTSIGSREVVSPMVPSVPKQTKCRSGVETRIKALEVGAPLTMLAGVVKSSVVGDHW